LFHTFEKINNCAYPTDLERAFVLNVRSPAGISFLGSDKHLKEKTMTSKFRLLAFGAILGFGACTFSAVETSAGALPLFPSTGGEVNTVSGGIIQVAQGKMRSNWEERRDGRRCSRREGDCRHFHDGFYYATPWWTLPLIIGGNVGYDNAYGRLSCGEARARVRHSGFRNVSTVECNGRTYTFEATHRGRDVTVFVNSRTGAIWRG
jgi:hypothetical protein